MAVYSDLFETAEADSLLVILTGLNRSAITGYSQLEALAVTNAILWQSRSILHRRQLKVRERLSIGILFGMTRWHPSTGNRRPDFSNEVCGEPRHLLQPAFRVRGQLTARWGA
jgi:hypothetical protein